MERHDQHTDATPKEARAALAAADRMAAAGLDRGLYPRGFAFAMSLWAGSLAATVGSAVWLPLFAAGLVGYTGYRRRRGAWVREVQGRGDLAVVLVLGLLVGAVFVGGYVARWHFDLRWAQPVAGVVVAAGLLTATELTYGRTRARLRADRRS
jgi:4-amino-4-deoxy-L-arabinose transferase-like glycosyltransferase